MSLLRIQQILLFRELRILNSQEFNPLEALKRHRIKLENKVNRVERLIRTIEWTIANLEGKRTRKEQDYFRGFDETKYQQEVQERWGDTPQFLESHQNWSSCNDDQRKEIVARGQRLFQEMVLEGPRFAVNYEEIREGGAAFVREAVCLYCAR